MTARAPFLALCLAAMLRPAGAPAQAADHAGAESRADAQPVHSETWRPLRIAKWTTLGAAVAAAGYGFSASLAADERYDRIEAACRTSGARCEVRLSSGAYADAELEGLRDEARHLDRRARLALLAGQVAVAASLVLFVLDLQDNPAPPNVPYEPPRIRLAPSADGGARLIVRVR